MVQEVNLPRDSQSTTPDNVKVRSDVLSDATHETRESNTVSVGLQGASSLTVSGLAYSNFSIDLLAIRTQPHQ
jgi:hypothetical protein